MPTPCWQPDGTGGARRRYCHGGRQCESDLKITEHYTDTAGFTEHVFTLMHLLGFAFSPRIRDIHEKRLVIHQKAERYSGKQSVISTTSLNLKDIEARWDKILYLAASIKQGIVTASLIMKMLGKVRISRSFLPKLTR